ncbi:MAG: hypothetical protein LJE65_17775 [Desulfobacteraceae bacterium]|jgi:hypothetical protein|nr:hypothetical protein [Desulfobacteraceae bacterium]
MEFFEDIPFSLDREVLLQRMRLVAGTKEADEFEALVDRAEAMGRPKAGYTVRYIDEKGEDTVTIGGVTFTSAALRRNLEGLERVFPFLATCGREVEDIVFDRQDFVRAYYWDTIKGALLECARRHLQQHLEARFLLKTTAAMSPGSGDVDIWPIEQQRLLFGLIGDLPPAVGVTLTESCLMIPVKSISGIRFPSEHDFRSCTVCRRENCPSRTAPFDPDLWESLH